jgi:hypothetical protein
MPNLLHAFIIFICNFQEIIVYSINAVILREYPFSAGGVMISLWWIAILAITLLLLVAGLVGARRKLAHAEPLVRAKKQFHVQRERLEAKFVQLASAHVGSEAPQWTDCSFEDDVAYVRSRKTGELSAFVAVTIATEASAYGLQHGASIAQTLQAGTAVFRFDQDHWVTDGRAILNLSPNEAAKRFGGDLELVAQEIAQRG